MFFPTTILENAFHQQPNILSFVCSKLVLLDQKINKQKTDLCSTECGTRNSSEICALLY